MNITPAQLSAEVANLNHRGELHGFPVEVIRLGNDVFIYVNNERYANYTITEEGEN